MKSILLIQPSKEGEHPPSLPPTAGIELKKILVGQDYDSRLQLLKKGNRQYIYMMDDRLTNQPLHIDNLCQEIILSKNISITSSLQIWLNKANSSNHFIIVPPNQRIALRSQTNAMIIHNKTSLDATLAPNQMNYTDLLNHLATDDQVLNHHKRAQFKTYLFSGAQNWDNFRVKVMHVMAKIHLNREHIREMIGEIVPILKYEGFSMNEIINLLQLCNVKIAFHKGEELQEQQFIRNVVGMMYAQGYNSIEVHHFLSAMNLHTHPVCRKINNALQVENGIEQVFSMQILKFLSPPDVSVLFTVLNWVTKRSPNMISVIPRSIYSLFSKNRQEDTPSNQLTIGY